MSENRRWREPLSALHSSLALRDWLREPASLTARLQRHGRFRLQVLRQRLHHANADEAGVLGLQPRSRCQVREVLLHCNDVPVIFAHTVLPIRPRGVLSRWLAGLGGRSLGSLLFAHPGFVRGRLAYARIDQRHPLYARASVALGVTPPLFFARRCAHDFGSQRVLVTEVFSPAIAFLRLATT
jgi:chorismate--pyruvate lyase